MNKGVYMATLHKEAKCPICGLKYKYAYSNDVPYHPSTCNTWECIYKFHHKKAIEARKQRGF